MGIYDHLRNLQDSLAKRVRTCPLENKPQTAAGVDVSVDTAAGTAHAAIVVMDRSLTVIESVSATRPLSFPYVPGLLSFREMPVLLLAWKKLRVMPDVFIVDGQGIAHPRRMGLAAHFGVVFDVPAVGCAKSRLVGEHHDVDEHKGSRTPLMYQDSVIGAVVRTRQKVKPVFVSPGHRCDIDDAVSCVLDFTSRYRLPDPVRQAHNRSNIERRNHSTLTTPPRLS